MKRRKGSMRKMLDLGLTMGVSSAAVSSLPTNDISPQVVTGMAKTSEVFPAYGRMAGLGMILGGAKRVLKKTKKLGKIR